MPTNVALTDLNYFQGFLTHFMFQQALLADDALDAIVYKSLLSDLTPKRVLTKYQVSGMYPIYGDACSAREVGELTSDNTLIERRQFPTTSEIDICAFKDTAMFNKLVQQAGANTDLNTLFTGTRFAAEVTQAARRNYAYHLTAKRWFANLTGTNVAAFQGMFTDLNGHYTNALNSSDTKKVTTSNANTPFAAGAALTLAETMLEAKSSVAWGQNEVLIIGQYFAKSLRKDLIAANQNAIGYMIASDNALESHLGQRFGVPVRISRWIDTYYMMSLQTTTPTPNRDGSYDNLTVNKYPKIAVLARVATTEQESVFLEDYGMGAGTEPAFYLRDYKDKERDGLQLKMRVEVGTGIINDSAAVITVV